MQLGTTEDSSRRARGWEASPSSGSPLAALWTGTAVARSGGDECTNNSDLVNSSIFDDRLPGDPRARIVLTQCQWSIDPKRRSTYGSRSIVGRGQRSRREVLMLKLCGA